MRFVDSPFFTSPASYEIQKLETCRFNCYVNHRLSSQRSPLKEGCLRFVGSPFFDSPASLGQPEVAFKILQLETCKFYCFANPRLSGTRFQPEVAFKGEKLEIFSFYFFASPASLGQPEVAFKTLQLETCIGCIVLRIYLAPVSSERSPLEEQQHEICRFYTFTPLRPLWGSRRSPLKPCSLKLADFIVLPTPGYLAPVSTQRSPFKEKNLRFVDSIFVLIRPIWLPISSQRSSLTEISLRFIAIFFT